MRKFLNKKILSLILIVTFFVNSNSIAFAKEDPYEKVLNEINAEYGLELGCLTIDPTEASVAEYEKFIRQIAEQQVQLKQMIANRKPFADSSIMPFAENASKTVTVTKDAWAGYENQYTITATYDVDGKIISNPRNIYAN